MKHPNQNKNLLSKPIHILPLPHFFSFTTKTLLSQKYLLNSYIHLQTFLHKYIYTYTTSKFLSFCNCICILPMETADNLSLRVASFSYYLDTAKDHSLLHRSVSSQETTINPILMTSSSNPTMIKPPFTIKFSKPKEISQLDHTASNNLRTDSFSYRNTSAADNKNFVFENPGPVKDPTSSFAFSQPNNKDGEIGVFGADRYFNMKLEYKTEPAKKNNNTRGPENPARVGSSIPAIGPRTPSLSSEASSVYNYQTALLPAGGSGRDLQRYGSSDQAAKHNNKKAIGRRIFNGFGCKGPCFDKKSIHINEVVPDGPSSLYGPKPARNGSERISIPAIKPVDKSPTANINRNNTIKVVQDDLDELSRNSIEVFGSSTQSTKGEVATNMERKLSMLTWDAIPINNKGQLLTPPPAKSTTTLGSSTTICDNADMASDASSDLFEIENISGSSVFPLVLTSSSSELLPREDQMSPRISHYAPSEASIQWSVVTASAADYSILSDYNNNVNNDEMSVSVAGDLVTRAVKTKGGGQGGKSEGQKSRPAGGLLGCKSDKSVDVAENVLCHKANEKVVKNVGPDSNVSFGKSGRVKDMDHALKSPRSLPMVI
ncbi:hypothetical protein ABFS83_04G158500 [Erythranthe nasuta]